MEMDSRILELIPHRPPMLLIDKLVSVSKHSAEALVEISTASPFMSAHGVPAWIGLEYMGQTAALIAGFQQRQGLCGPHLGFLIGSRNFDASVSTFDLGLSLLVRAEQAAVVGESLATFKCTIEDNKTKAKFAEAMLSVFREPLREQTQNLS